MTTTLPTATSFISEAQPKSSLTEFFQNISFQPHVSKDMITELRFVFELYFKNTISTQRYNYDKSTYVEELASHVLKHMRTDSTNTFDTKEQHYLHAEKHLPIGWNKVSLDDEIDTYVFGDLSEALGHQVDILSIEAHADDFAYWRSPLLQENTNIHVAYTTDGSLGMKGRPRENIANIRKHEALKEAEMYGIKVVHFFKLPDGYSTNHAAKINHLSEKAIRISKPKKVTSFALNNHLPLKQKYNHQPQSFVDTNEMHSDHRIGNLVFDASSRARYTKVPNNHNLKTFIEVSSHHREHFSEVFLSPKQLFERWRGLSAHTSQMPSFFTDAIVNAAYYDMRSHTQSQFLPFINFIYIKENQIPIPHSIKDTYAHYAQCS